MIEDCTAVILAGGESKRMGQDKASLLLHGETLLTHAINNLQPLFENIIISVREKRDDTALPQICDAGEDRGPIMGIAAALKQVRTDWIFVTAVDMPFVSSGLIQMMARQRALHDAVSIYAYDMPQPLFCFYAKSCLQRIKTNIEQGERSLKQLLRQVNGCFITEDEARNVDADLRSLVSLDTTADLQAWGLCKSGAVRAG